MSLWSDAYEEAAASLRSSPSRPSPRPERTDSLSEARSPEPAVETAIREAVMIAEPTVVTVGSPALVQPATASGRVRLLGFDRRVVDSRSASPVRQPLPRARSTSRGPVWRGGLIEEVAARPLASQGKGGMLSLHAAERGARWGSLQSSWQVKNAFEAWRGSSASQRAGEENLLVAFDDSYRIRELELLVVERERKIASQEQQLIDVSASVEAERRRHSEILQAIGSIRSGPDLGPVLEALAAVRVDVQAQDKTVQDLRSACAEQSHALRRGIEASERATGEFLHRSLSELRAGLVGSIEECSDSLRTDFGSRTQAATREILSVLGRQEQEELKELKHAVMELKGESKELKELKHVSKELKQAVNGLQSDVKQLDTDQSRVLSAINMSADDLMTAVRAVRPDYTPVLQAIHSLRDPDYSEVLEAVRRISNAPDFSPIIAAIRKLPADLDFPSASDQMTKSLEKAIFAVDTNTGKLSQSIQSLPIAINSMLRDLKQDTLEAVARNVKASIDPIIRAIAAADVDFEPVLDSIRIAKAEIQATTSASLQRFSSDSLRSESPQQATQVQVQPSQVRLQQVQAAATPPTPSSLVQPVFSAWRQAASTRQPVESQLVQRVPQQTVEPQIFTHQTFAPQTQIVPQQTVVPQQQTLVPQNFTVPLSAAQVVGQAQVRATSLPSGTRRFVTNWTVGSEAPALTPRGCTVLESPRLAAVDSVPRPASVTTVMSQPRNWEESSMATVEVCRTGLPDDERSSATTCYLMSPRDSFGGMS